MDKRIGLEAFHLHKHSVRLDAADASPLYAAKLWGMIRHRTSEVPWGSSSPLGPPRLGIAWVHVCSVFLVHSLWHAYVHQALPDGILSKGFKQMYVVLPEEREA